MNGTTIHTIAEVKNLEIILECSLPNKLNIQSISKSCRAAVPNLSGTRDQFRGR